MEEKRRALDRNVAVLQMAQRQKELRDRFAEIALKNIDPWMTSATDIAQRVYEIADAMLAAREKA